MYNDKSKSKCRDSCKLWLCLGCSKNWGQKWWLESVGTLSIYLGWWSHHTLEHDNVIHERIHWMSLSVPEQMAWTSNNIDNSEGFINQSAVENDSWKSTKIENKQWFVLFCMHDVSYEVNWIDVAFVSDCTRLSYDWSNLLHCLPLYWCNRPTTRDIASGPCPMGTAQQISRQYIDWWVNKVKIAMKLALPQLFGGTSHYNTIGL